jgi:hypothetical protein
MKKKNIIYKTPHRIASIFMILALLWLTVSIPFVYSAQQKMAEKEKAALTMHAASEKNGDGSNPFTNTTEEKTPSGAVNILSEEYLHHTDELFHIAGIWLKHTGQYTVAEYIAFHGELLCPPPNFGS